MATGQTSYNDLRLRLSDGTITRNAAHLDSGGLLGPHIEPLKARLGQMLGSGANAGAEVARRVRLLSCGRPATSGEIPGGNAAGRVLLRCADSALSSNVFSSGVM